MMKNRLTLIIGFIYCLNIHAQCSEVYMDAYYTDVHDTTVLYSEPQDLYMDIYQPEGDVNLERPLIILAHGGTFVAGFRFNPTMMFLGEEFAKRGYVVASIDYRLMSVFDLLDYNSSMDGVCEAIGDGRAAVRYFRKSIEQGNPYRINPDQIYFGGNSAGGVIAMHVGLMQETDVQDEVMLDILAQNGGFEGDSGNDGYSSSVNGVISLAGAIHSTDFINEADLGFPIISCHTVNDGTVPYECGEALNLSTVPELCGAGAVKNRTEELNFTTHHHLDFDGNEHVPWEFFSESQDQMFNFINSQMYDLVSCPPVNSQTVNLMQGWTMISTYIDVEGMTLAEAFSEIIEDVIIAKDNIGAAFLPEWNFDGIGPIQNGEAFAVKLENANSLLFNGTPVDPNDYPLTLEEGWNMVGYLLQQPKNVELVFTEIVAEDNLIIVKDVFGHAYLPDWDFNGIGDMNPGQGYLVKVFEEDILQY